MIVNFKWEISIQSSVDGTPLWVTRECGARVDNYSNSLVKIRKNFNFISSHLNFEEAKEMEKFIEKNAINQIKFDSLKGTKDDHVYIIKADTIRTTYPDVNLQAIEFSVVQVGL